MPNARTLNPENTIFPDPLAHAEVAIAEACHDIEQEALKLSQPEEARRFQLRVRRIGLFIEHIEQVTGLRADYVCSSYQEAV